MSADAAMCTHSRVERRTAYHRDGTCTDEWWCQNCAPPTQFVPLTVVDSLKAELAEVTAGRDALEALDECGVDGIPACTMRNGQPTADSDWCRMCLLAELRRARRECEKFRADFAKDQAEIASLRIDLGQAAKVTADLRTQLDEATAKAAFEATTLPACPGCGATLGGHHGTVCPSGHRGLVLPSEIPGFVESVATEVLARKPR